MPDLDLIAQGFRLSHGIYSQNAEEPDYLPNANIVFDHFHVIKLMNEKVDKIRRNVLEKLDNEQKALLKNQRFTLLRNYEDLKPEGKGYMSDWSERFKDTAAKNCFYADFGSKASWNNFDSLKSALI